MASQYSHLQFFRRVPHALLSQYFSSRGISLEIDWETLKPSDGESILKAFMLLDDARQVEIEAQLQDVHALACDGGIAALVDEAAFHDDEDFADEISEIKGHHAKVMWALLEKSEYRRGATKFLHLENVIPSYWKKRNDLPRLPPHEEDIDIEARSKAISDLFTKKGRGKNCKEEPYRRHNREYFFAYPEDFAQLGVEWISNTLKTIGTWTSWRIRACTVVAVVLSLSGYLTTAVAQTTDIETEYLMTLYAPLQPAQVVNTDLFIFNVREGGYVDGPQIKGKILSPGGDWIRQMPNGAFRLDVRLTIQTEDNALIYVEYGGILKYNEVAAERLDKGDILGVDEAYFITTPRFQTTAVKYAWLNDIQAIGRMVSLKRGDHVTYEIFAVR